MVPTLLAFISGVVVGCMDVYVGIGMSMGAGCGWMAGWLQVRDGRVEL